MAELVGVFEIPVGPTPTGPLADMSTQLGDNTAPQASGEALAKSDIGGALSSSAPYPGRELPVYGAIEPGFGADYYNRVHIVPDSLNVGNLLSTQTRPVEVWNAHRSTKLLSGISQSGTDGMTLIEPYAAPTTFGVFESRTYTLQVGTAGSPVIDAAYVFAFRVSKCGSALWAGAFSCGRSYPKPPTESPWSGRQTLSKALVQSSDWHSGLKPARLSAIPTC